MSNVIGTVRSLRVFVEPVDVELDDDNGILWSSLQTAFPGCSGMYYKQRGVDCKSAVRFDGKKFQPPGGAWNDRDYFVTLSQRCHAVNGQNNVNNYESATKQFERSVHAVQKMLASTKFGTIDLATPRTHREKPANVVNVQLQQSSATSDFVDPIKERTRLLKNLDRELTPIEQQFVDLAKISTAKDSIIDARRSDIVELQQQIHALERELRTAEAKISDVDALTRAQEEELQMLRSLGSAYGTSTEKVEELTAQLNNSRREFEETRSNLQSQLNSLDKELFEVTRKNEILKAQLETGQNRVIELEKFFSATQKTNESLEAEVQQLRPLAATIGLVGELENLPTYVSAIGDLRRLREENTRLNTEKDATRTALSELQNVYYPVVEHNSSLQKENEEMAGRLERIDEEMKFMNSDLMLKFKEKQDEWNRLKADAEAEVTSLREQIEQLQTILDSATREATENARRVEELNAEKFELTRAVDAAELKGQESLRRQVRNLTDDLREAETRVAELSGLVASLASDASNSRRDINDIL